mgnify:CR=1 FL=1
MYRALAYLPFFGLAQASECVNCGAGGGESSREFGAEFSVGRGYSEGQTQFGTIPERGGRGVVRGARFCANPFAGAVFGAERETASRGGWPQKKRPRWFGAEKEWLRRLDSNSSKDEPSANDPSADGLTAIRRQADLRPSLPLCASLFRCRDSDHRWEPVCGSRRDHGWISTVSRDAWLPIAWERIRCG